MPEVSILMQSILTFQTGTFDISHLLLRLPQTSFPETDSYALLAHSPEELQRKHLIIYIYIHDFHRHHIVHGDRGSTVVKALCYKSEGRWFDSR